MEVDYNLYSEKLKNFIDSSEKKVASILIHKNADGDCVGAGLALSFLLEKEGYTDVKIISTNAFNDNYLWMPNSDKIVVFDSMFKDICVDHINNSDVVFCVDFVQKCRIDDVLPELIKDKKICIIDHHLEQSEFEGEHIINSSAASTCEILYELISRKYNEKIDYNIALSLYTGIMTDTGRFTTQNMTYRVHEISAEILKKYDIDISLVNKNIYGNNRFARMRFLGHVLSKCLKVVPEYKVAFITLSHKDTSRFYLKQGETDGIVNYGLSMKNIVVSALFNEKKEGVYISLRSIGDFAVNEFAKQYFNGGGHKNAAGGYIINKTLDESVQYFIDLIKKIDSLKLEI